MEKHKELLQIGGPIILEESDSGKEILSAEEHAENSPTNPCGNSYAGLRCSRVGVDLQLQYWWEHYLLLYQCFAGSQDISTAHLVTVPGSKPQRRENNAKI